MNSTTYQHAMAAHCESGVISGLLRHHGLDLSEPLIFGISGAMFFGYFDTTRTTAPMLAFRNRPGDIRKQIAKRLGVRFDTQTFGSAAKGQVALDQLLAQGKPVGAQVDMFSMEYIPPWMRVHVNAHFVVIAGKDGDHYIVSDCYYPELGRVSVPSMNIGRFAKGSFAPKGLLIQPVVLPLQADLPKAIREGIKYSCRFMTGMPIPLIGVKGIRTFAKKINDWPAKIKDEQYLSHCFMSINLALEERGTGGAGFRFLYATFLQQAAKVTGMAELDGLSHEMMANGDCWRDISLAAARIGKKRDFSAPKIKELSDLIAERARVEEKLFTELARAVK